LANSLSGISRQHGEYTSGLWQTVLEDDDDDDDDGDDDNRFSSIKVYLIYLGLRPSLYSLHHSFTIFW